MKNIKKKIAKISMNYLLVIIDKIVCVASLLAVVGLCWAYVYGFNGYALTTQLLCVALSFTTWKASKVDNAKLEKRISNLQTELKNTDLSLLSPKNLANNNKPEKVEKTKEIKLTKKEPKKEATKPDEKPKKEPKKEGVVNA